MQNDLYDLVIGKNEIDYSTVTVCDGRIMRRRTYYKCQDTKLPDVGIDYFDNALSSGDILCFSIGFDKSFCIKYDFSLRNANLINLYGYLSREYRYFDNEKIKTILDFFTRFDLKFDNHVLGIRVPIDSANIGVIGICPYFRIGKNEIDNDRCLNIINELMSLFIKKPEPIYIPQSCNCRLHMIALDFAPDEFKLKIYFRFDDPLIRINTPLVNAGNSCFDIIESTVRDGERLEFFQIALKEQGELSYNLYFKPCT